MIIVTNLTKDYGSRRAINNISFHANKGEILGLLGPNGAGKTTTMRILSGYLPFTSGMVVVGGNNILEKSLQVRAMIGYLPETVPLYQDMTPREYLHYMGSLRKVKQLKQRVDEILALVNLTDRAGGYISKLSKGMRQRLGLAQALIHSPQVLILDEPTIGLDPAQIIEIRNLIKDLGKKTTILISTHILSEAQQLCDRVIILNKGSIVAEDTPQRLQTRLYGGERVFVKIRGNIKEALSYVEDTPGITSVSIHTEDSLEFDTAPGFDVRPEVVRILINANFDLLEIKSSVLSLEDIFLKLTRDEPAPLEIGQSNQAVSAEGN